MSDYKDEVVVGAIEEHLESIMKLLEIDKTESNKNTPHRVAKMWVKELFVNRNNRNISDLDRQITTFPNIYGNDVVIMRGIKFNSMCFTSKTPIKVKGGTKYIRDIKEGDIVLTISDKGEVVEAPVTNVMKRVVNDTLIVHTANGKHLRCTPNHPFYVVDKGWVNAEDLEPNDPLVCLNKGDDLNKSSTWDFTVKEGYSFGYVLGAIASDGSTWRNQTRLEVNDEFFANEFCTHLKEAFNIEAIVTKSKYSSGFTPNKYEHRNLVRIVSGYFVDYLRRVFDGSTGSKDFCFPKIVLNSYESFRGFIHGYYMGDGTSYKGKYVRIISANKDFSYTLANILRTTIDYRQGVYIIPIPLHLFGLNKRQKYEKDFMNRFCNEIMNKEKVNINPLISTTSVLSIEELPPHEVTVYNFEVENHHTYLAGDILVHNCEHHWLPFSGEVTVAYVPDKKIIGLSKIPRIVKYFSKKPTLQEKLGKEILDYLNFAVKPIVAKVVIKSTHSCVKCRGAESDCETVTQVSIVREDISKEAALNFLTEIDRNIGR